MAETPAPNPVESQRLAALREAQTRRRQAPAGGSYLGNLARGAMLSGTMMLGLGANAPEQPQQEEDAIAATQPGGADYSPTSAAREAVRASRLQESQQATRGGTVRQGGRRVPAQLAMVAAAA